MISHQRTSGYGKAWILLPLLFAGCGLFEDNSPDKVRIRLGETDVAELVLVVSEEFLAQRVPVYAEDGTTVIETQTRVELLEADTLRITVPFEQTFDISDSRRFYALTLNAPDGVRMRADVDGDMKYDAVASEGLGKLEFVYAFQNISDPDDPNL